MIKAAHLYYDLMNLYGDSGNMKALACHIKEAGADFTVDELCLGEKPDFSEYDIVYIGSGTEHNLMLALDDIMGYKKELEQYKADGGILLATGNSIELFGRQIKTASVTKEALGIFGFTAEYGERVVRDVCAKCALTDKELIGFENHAGSIGTNEAVLSDEGFYLTYIIGPVLVRNPQLSDFFIRKLLEKKNEKTASRPDYRLEEKAYEVFRASMAH